MYLFIRVIVCWWTSTVWGPQLLGDLVLWVDCICLRTFFVQGPCSSGDIVMFVWGLHLFGDLICPTALVFQWPYFSKNIGSFADLIHPVTWFVPSLCLPGALICPHPWFSWDLFCLGTLFFSLPFLMWDPVNLETCSLGYLICWRTLSFKGTGSFRDLHDGDLVWLGTLLVRGCSGAFV